MFRVIKHLGLPLDQLSMRTQHFLRIVGKRISNVEKVLGFQPTVGEGAHLALRRGHAQSEKGFASAESFVFLP